LKKWSKFAVSVLATGVIALGSAYPTNATVNYPNVVINGGKVTFQGEKPYETNGVTMIPVREIAENMGINVKWDEKTQTVIFSQGTKTVTLKIGSKTATIKNGTKTTTVTLSSPAVKKNNYTFVPLRFVADAFNGKVEWHSEFNTPAAVIDTESYVNNQRWYSGPAYMNDTLAKKLAVNFSYFGFDSYTYTTVDTFKTAKYYHFANIDDYKNYFAKKDSISITIGTGGVEATFNLDNILTMVEYGTYKNKDGSFDMAILVKDNIKELWQGGQHWNKLK
jgi:hypothetical protein